MRVISSTLPESHLASIWAATPAEKKETDTLFLLADKALAAALDAILIIDATMIQNPIIYVNPSFERMTGYSAEDVLGQSFHFLQGKEADQAAFNGLRQAMREGREWQGTLTSRRKNDERFYNELRISPVVNNAGTLTHFIAIGTDVTQRMTVEKELQQTTQLLYSVIENIPDMIFLKDAKELRFELFNKAGETLLGHPRDSMIGKNDYDFFPAEQADFFTAKDREALAQKEVTEIAEEVIETKWQEKRILHTKKVPILNELNEPRYLLGISEDITEKIEAEKALEQAYAHLEEKVAERTAELAEANAILIQQIEARQAIEQQREKIEVELRKSLGRERLLRGILEVIGQSFDVHFILNFTAQEVGRFFEPDRCLVSHYEKQSDQLAIKIVGQYCKNPSIQPIAAEDIPLKSFALLEWRRARRKRQTACLTNITPPMRFAPHLAEFTQQYGIESAVIVEICYRGNAYGFLTLNQCRSLSTEDRELLQNIATQVGVALYQADLYKLEQTAKQQAEMETKRKDLFLATMSHEFRTPLNAIIGFSEMMRQEMIGPLNEKQQKYINNVFLSGQHLLDMVNDILDLAKIAAGRVTLYREPFDVYSITQEVETVLKQIADEKKIQLTVFIQSELKFIQADPARFRQILYNLISNAIKFNREGGQVTVRLSKMDDKLSPSQQWLLGEIEDTGIGISLEQLPKLFTDFYQVDDSFSRRHQGTGLGLALTKKLVELHGGKIGVESHPGLGSTFWFTLPL